MKKLLALALGATLCLALLAGCGKPATPAEPETPDEGGATAADITVKVAATPAPHAEILEVAKEVLAEEGITLEIIEYNDYIQPNTVTEDGQVDANFFQHMAYLNDFNAKNGTHLVSVAEIHYEPYGLYAGKVASIEELQEGATIAVPNDPSNEARALLLLEEVGLIKLTEGIGLEATKLDIIENKLKLDIQEIEAAQLPRSLDSVDMAVINGNYAIEAGLNVATDAVAIEDAEGENTKNFYANVLVVKEGNEENAGIVALVKALQSDKVRDFIETTYKGAVVPLF